MSDPSDAVHEPDPTVGGDVYAESPHYDERMAVQRQGLRFYGQPSDHEALDWAWVDNQLRTSGTYWVVARSTVRPHPRPIWGIWHDSCLYVSIGSPALLAQLATDPVVTVHLESGNDVVIVEGRACGPCDDAKVIAAYDAKYDWSYDLAEYGPLTSITPTAILAWQASGWAGRGGFERSGRWNFPATLNAGCL